MKDFLKLVTTTSPSYILMASLDYARALMESKGRLLTEKVLELSEKARGRINKHTPFYCVGREVCGEKGIADIDLSRLMVNVSQAGYTGYEVEKILRKRFNIYAEYADLGNIYFLPTFANTKRDIRRLVSALSAFKNKDRLQRFSIILDKIPKMAMNPREAFYSPGKYLSLKKSSGSIAKKALVPYPPGIPLVMPGEVIEDTHIKILTLLLNAGGSCQGLTSDGLIQVLSD